MKRFLTVALAAGMTLAVAGMASAVDTYNATDAAGGIGNSRHNLGSLGEHVRTDATTEICIFCHTPHHTNKTKGMGPIWNRGTPSSTFTAYGTTIAGTNVANADIGSVSLACLSCHDGTTTFDNIVNAPGKKGGNSGTGSDQGWTFTDVGAVISDFMTSGRLNIGTDLSNDHPMSVVYSGGTKASLRTTGTTISGINLLSELATSAATFDGGNLTKNLWAVKGFISADAKIGDLLRGADGRVECSSCHDPHFNNKSWNEVDKTYSAVVGDQEPESNGLFLRRVGGNSGSGVCRTCHNK